MANVNIIYWHFTIFFVSTKEFFFAECCIMAKLALYEQVEDAINLEANTAIYQNEISVYNSLKYCRRPITKNNILK